MTNVGTSGGGETPMAGSMSSGTAIRVAWVGWLVLLAVPFLVFLIALWQHQEREAVTTGSGAAVSGESNFWFLATSLYLLVVVPISFFWRSHIFRSYWSGKTVEPSKYLAGMFSIWIALEIGGIASLIGCIVSNALLPCLLPALIAFMFFVTFWPSGRAMTRPVGNYNDPQIYEEPR